MTTPPVVSITDELIAELEAAANEAKSAHPGAPWYYQERSDAYTHIVRVDNPELNNSMIVTQLAQRTDGVSEAVGRHIAITNPDNIKALLAHIAELKQQLAAASADADRYRWLREACDNDPGNLGIEYACKPGVDAAIDAARTVAGD